MNIPPRWFAEEVAAMHLCFPSARFDQAVPIAWWHCLREYPEWALRKALRQAPREAAQGQYLPSAECVRRIAAVLAAHPPETRTSNQAALPEPAVVALPETNPFAQLARQWEAESAARGAQPNDPAPQEIATRRAAELAGLLEGKLKA